VPGDGDGIGSLLGPGAHRSARGRRGGWGVSSGEGDWAGAAVVCVGNPYGACVRGDCHSAKQQRANCSETYSHDSVFLATPKQT
jgi:hypothetical protein